LHIAALRKRAAEADAKLTGLYDAIEYGIADLSDTMSVHNASGLCVSTLVYYWLMAC